VGARSADHRGELRGELFRARSFDEVDELAWAVNLPFFVSDGHVFHPLSQKSDRRVEHSFLRGALSFDTVVHLPAWKLTER
jgi:hypothetical protein